MRKRCVKWILEPVAYLIAVNGELMKRPSDQLFSDKSGYRMQPLK